MSNKSEVRCLEVVQALEFPFFDLMYLCTSQELCKTSLYFCNTGTQMVTSKRASDLPIIEGCLLGLHGLLFSFTSSYTEELVRCQQIFKYAWMSLRPQVDLTRFAVPLGNFSVYFLLFSVEQSRQRLNS